MTKRMLQGWSLVAGLAVLAGAASASAQVRMSFPGSRPAMAPRGGGRPMPASGPRVRQAAPNRQPAPVNRVPGFQPGRSAMPIGQFPGHVNSPRDVGSPATTRVVLPNGGLVFRPGTTIAPVPNAGPLLEQSSGIGHGGFGHGGFGHGDFGHGNIGHGGFNRSLSGSGLTIDGRFSGDNWKLGVHVGSGYPNCAPIAGDKFCWPVPCQPVVVWPANPYWGFPWWGYGYAYDGYRYDTVYGIYTPADPALTTAPVSQPAITETPQPSNNRELGDAYLRGGDTKAAIRSYRTYLNESPRDAVAIRSLAMALLEQGQPAEAAATMTMAYRTNAALAGIAISTDIYANGTDDFRKNLQRMSIYANRTKLASAWLSLAVMMQGEGRNDLAKAMLERARDAGLDAAIAERMMAAVRN